MNAVSARDDRGILEEGEKAEDYTKARFAEAMKLDLAEGAHAMVKRQYHIIVANHDRIRELRDRS